MDYKDYYTILEVDRKANEKDIKRSYRRLAQKYHPDKNPNDKSAEDKFKEINEAYEVIGDSENRQKYDRLGQSYHRYQQMGGAAGGFDYSQWAQAGGGSGNYQRVNIDLNDLFDSSGGFSDFFNTIFGGGFRTQRRGQQQMFVCFTALQWSHGHGRGGAAAWQPCNILLGLDPLQDRPQSCFTPTHSITPNMCVCCVWGLRSVLKCIQY